MPPRNVVVLHFICSNRKYSGNEYAVFYQRKEFGALLMSSNVKGTLLWTIYPSAQQGL